VQTYLIINGNFLQNLVKFFQNSIKSFCAWKVGTLFGVGFLLGVVPTWGRVLLGVGFLHGVGFQLGVVPTWGNVSYLGIRHQ